MHCEIFAASAYPLQTAYRYRDAMLPHMKENYYIILCVLFTMYPIQYGPILQATRMPSQSRTKSSQSMGAVASFIPKSTNRKRNSASPKF